MQGPSNKVALFFILLVLVVTGTIAFSARDKTPKVDSTPEASNMVTMQRDTQNSTVDTDKDGLFDWEETLRLSDPTNPDTDNDGSIDGSEVKEGRDPTVAGPNDTFAEVAQQKLDSIEPIYEHYEEGTLTAQLASNFLLNYAQYGSDPTYSTDIEPTLINKLVADVDSITDIANIYTLLDIQTFPFDKERVRIYGNEFATIHKKLLEGLLASSNPDPTAYLNTLSSLYDSIAEELASMEVPYSLADLHLEAANNFSRVGAVLYEINNNTETDPVRSLFAIKDYNAAADAQFEIYTLIAAYFRDNDIIFETTEPGNFWNNI